MFFLHILPQEMYALVQGSHEAVLEDKMPPDSRSAARQGGPEILRLREEVGHVKKCNEMGQWG